MNLGETLSLDGLYAQSNYQVGVYSEKEKADTMLKDLEQKQRHLDDLFRGKEELEAQIAPLACIHSIYVRLLQSRVLENIQRGARRRET